MNKMMVLAKAVEGRVEELARWYDERHFKDLLTIPGFVSAERHTLVPVKKTGWIAAMEFHAHL